MTTSCVTTGVPSARAPLVWRRRTRPLFALLPAPSSLAAEVFQVARASHLEVRDLVGHDPQGALVNPAQDLRDCRTDCLRELKKIKLAWPELNYFTPKGVLILSPSEPSIPRLSTGGISRQGF